MPTFLICDVRILNPGREVSHGNVLLRGGRIVATGLIPHAALSDVKEAVCIDGENRLLTPGLIDLHAQGIMHRLNESGPVGLRAAARELSRVGVTTALPTIVPQIQPGWIGQLGSTVQALASIREMHIPGLHLAGPFVTRDETVCPTPSSGMEVLEQILAACGDRLAAMSLSPDTPGILPVIRRLRSAGIPVFLSPSRATIGETEAAIEAGATHRYEVLHPSIHSNRGAGPPGAARNILTDPRANGGFNRGSILRYDTIDAANASRSWTEAALIMGAQTGAGGKEDPAGSARAMNRGVADLLQWLRLPPQQAWAMATLNSARILGLERKGRLEPGADADLVLWEEDLTPALTWVGGECTFTKTKTPRTVPVI